MGGEMGARQRQGLHGKQGMHWFMSHGGGYGCRTGRPRARCSGAGLTCAVVQAVLLLQLW